MPTWSNRRARDLSRAARRKAGYSLLEVMVALAIMSLSVAFIMPRAAAALDQVVVHTVQFDFQRQVSTLKRRAFLENRGFLVQPTARPGGEPAEPLAAPPRPSDASAESTPDSAAPAKDASAPEQVQVELRAGWTYSLSAPLAVTADARCALVQADLYNHGKPAAHMEDDRDCHFFRRGDQKAGG